MATIINIHTKGAFEVMRDRKARGVHVILISVKGGYEVVRIPKIGLPSITKHAHIVAALTDYDRN